MRAALEVSRSLKPGQCPRQAASRFLEGLKAASASKPGVQVGRFALVDAAALTQRFARHVPQPPQSFFCEVASHLEPPLHHWAQQRTIAMPVSTAREDIFDVEAPIQGTTAVVLADAFARSRCYDGTKLLGMVCLCTPPTLPLSAIEVLQFTESLTLLGTESFHDPAVRGFLLMRLKVVAEQMDGATLAQCAQHLAMAGLYSPEISEEVARQLAGNPWSFNPADLQCLLPHFSRWQLGELQKKAFHSLGRRFAEHAELLSPVQSLKVIETFTDIGNVHEVALQTLFLRLLLERSFTELGAGVARLAASMSKVQHYHAGLLREIVCYIQEEPQALEDWTASDLSGALRSIGLAPVKVPSATQVLLGCRYSALLNSMSNAELKDLFEISSWHPEILRGVVLRVGRLLRQRLSMAVLEWGPRACVDAALGLVLAADLSPEKAFTGCEGCACGAAGSLLPRNQFRTEQPEWQLQVVHRAARNYKQRGLRVRVAHPDVPLKGDASHLFFADEPAPLKLPRTSRCAAAWALPQGRRHQRVQPTRQLAALLGEVIPLLHGRLYDLSQALAELPGAAMPTALIEGLPPHLESIGGPLPAAPPMISEENMLPLPPSESSTENWWDKPPEEIPPTVSNGEVQERDLETMRRSEMLEVCVQSLAMMQLCFSAGPSSPLFSALPKETLRTMTRLVPMVSYLLRPRRDDPVAQRFQLGPLRMEAFVKRPDEKMQKEVYKTVQHLMPFLPRLLGWDLWDARPQDRLHGEKIGGALLALQRDLEIPPFIVCLVLKKASSRSGKRLV